MDIAEQHIKMAKSLDMIPMAVLPCASVIPVEETVRYAQMAESYGADGNNICWKAGGINFRNKPTNGSML